MSKKYKEKHDIKEESDTLVENNNGLSKKEIYDLKQKEKRAEREKIAKKNKSKSKKKKRKQKTYTSSLGVRIFAIVMLILMIGSVIAAISSYFMG